MKYDGLLLKALSNDKAFFIMLLLIFTKKDCSIKPLSIHLSLRE